MKVALNSETISARFQLNRSLAVDQLKDNKKKARQCSDATFD